MLESRSKGPSGGAGGQAMALLVLVLAAGCGKPRNLDQTPVPGVGCDADKAYEHATDKVAYEDFENGSNNWFGASDPTGFQTTVTGPDSSVMDAFAPLLASATVSVKQIENGGRCGSQMAMVLEASGNKDWGGYWGNWAVSNMITSGPEKGLDVSAYEGVGFWGRSLGVDDAGRPFPTDPGFNLELSDKHTTDFTPAGVVGRPDLCVVIDAGPTGTIVDPTTGQILGSVGADLNLCGNYFSRPVVLTSDWRFYLLPFSSFHQAPSGSRQPGGIDPSGLFLISIRPPKEAVAELWIDNFGFYRRKTVAPAADASIEAGTDAGRDSGTDAGRDSGADASVEGGTDAGEDASADAVTD